jgi:hypothetical protein
MFVSKIRAQLRMARTERDRTRAEPAAGRFDHAGGFTEEITAEEARVILAVTEIASFRAELCGPQIG